MSSLSSQTHGQSFVLLTLWTIDHQKIGEPVRKHAEVGDDTILPLFVKVQTISTFDPHRAQPASYGIVARAYSDYIEISVLTIFCYDTSLRKFADWRIDDVDVLSVTAFIVVLL